MPDVHCVIVTDLDGTLLHHQNYGYQDSLPTIDSLKAQGIPIILNTSKTFHETDKIRRTLGLADPFIVENGSCVYLPSDSADENTALPYWKIELGVSFEFIDNILNAMEHRYRFTRLSQCSVEQAMRITDLPESDAKLAIQREYSDPILWQDSEENLQGFTEWLRRNDLIRVQGGRFYSIQGKCSKGGALKFLLRHYYGNRKTIVLGDSENDAEMLADADVSVMVNSPSNTSLAKRITPDIKTKSPAPKGWAEGVNAALMQLKQKV